MKALSLAATLAFAAMPLLATPALAGSSPQDIAARYGITSGSNVGAMMQDPRAQAAMQEYAPQMAGNTRQMAAARAMNIGQLEAMARDVLPADVLAKLEAKYAAGMAHR